MRLATFNLYQYLAPPGYWYERKPNNTHTEAAWEAKERWIESQLAALDADVVGFQEVFSREPLVSLLERAGYPHVFVPDGDVRDAEDEAIHVAPRVALASRTPLSAITEIAPDAAGARLLGFEDGAFGFSRAPIAALVDVPGIGAVRVIVAHLKSKRPTVADLEYSDDTDWDVRVLDTMQRRSLGQIGSLRQRGAEATLLYHDITDHLAEHPAVPTVVLGDLNDAEDSIVFESLVMRDNVYDIGGVKRADWARGTSAALHRYRLTDAFRESPDFESSLRPYTHVHRGSPGTLDYILLSNHLNRANPRHVGEVTAFAVLNAHLESDGVGNRRQSDHGQVVVEIVARDAPLAPVDPPPVARDAASTESLSREAFVALAGGVFESSRQWSNWDGDDKYENFWAFYFDTDHGWVKSVYGDIPVSELHQRQRYSVEHIIPKSFLSRYLRSRGRPDHVRYGATVNPLNFAAAERGINSSRSNFPFDMDGDRVERPFRIDLNPAAYGTTGLDAELEWVIPPISRGDIARSILYMVLTYGIDELYNRHVDTLVHWAKVDPATAWELAFNAWVHGRLGVRNPFIDTPELANRYLDDRALLESVLIR